MQSYSLPGAPNSCRLPDDRHPAPNADIPKRNDDLIVILQHRIRPFVQLLQAFVDPPAPDPVQGFQIDGPFAPGRSLHRRLVHGTVRLPHIPGQKHIDRYGDRTVLVKSTDTESVEKRCQFYSYGTKARSSPYSGRRWVAGSSLSRHKSGSRPCWWNKHKTGPPGNSSTGTSELR